MNMFSFPHSQILHSGRSTFVNFPYQPNFTQWLIPICEYINIGRLDTGPAAHVRSKILMFGLLKINLFAAPKSIQKHWILEI